MKPSPRTGSITQKGAVPGADIAIQDLRVAFGDHGRTKDAVVDVTLTIPAGEFAAIVGPSGCGKSTVLNAVAGLRPPQGGQVVLDGKQVTGVSDRIGYLFQKDALLPWKTVLNNVMLGLRFRGVPRREAEERAREWLDRVHLTGFEDYYPHQLSGGMRKRVALAAVFVYEPSVLLMDEPFSALDVQTRNLMEDELLDIWNDTSSTVLFVTHDLEEAICLADRVIVFSAGPGTVKNDYRISLPRPRETTEIRFSEAFQTHFRSIWEDLRSEVQTAYDRQQATTTGKQHSSSVKEM